MINVFYFENKEIYKYILFFCYSEIILLLINKS